MELIKIFPDRVELKTNNRQLSDININSAMLVTDRQTDVSLVCVVTAISRNEQQESFDFDGNLLESEPNSLIECSIIGSLRDGKFTKSVDIYPTANVRVERIDDAKFGEMVSGFGSASLRIGFYANYGCPAFLDGNRFFQRHSAIVGSTGSGKSWTAASLLEKIAKLKSANVLLFDLHGEYSSLSFVKPIKVGGKGLSFPVWFLPLKDLYGNLLRIKEESAQNQVAALRRAFYAARRSDKSEEVPIAYLFQDLIERLESENTEELTTGEVFKSGARAGLEKTVKGENYGKLTSIINLLRDKSLDARYRFMVRPEPQEYLYQFIHTLLSIGDKNIKVLDLSDVPSDMVPTIIAVTSQLVYKAHLQQSKEQIVPLSLICDEAHVYIPSSEFGLGASQRRMLEIFETIAKEGRKFGVSLMIISQRPAELNRTILAQCANYIVLKLSNDADKQMIRGILPDSSKGMMDSVNLFQPGDCLVVGDSAPITFKIRLDRPTEAPRSDTLQVWDEWSAERNLDTDSLVDRILQI